MVESARFEGITSERMKRRSATLTGSITEVLKDPMELQGGSNMTGTDLCVNKPHCAAAVRP